MTAVETLTIEPGVGEPIIELQDVTKVFVSRKSPFAPAVRVVAAEGIDLVVRANETVALVGESGSGKSTIARLALRLVDATSGRVLIDGHDVTRAGEGRMRPLRKNLAMIFQDPYTCLNPRHSVARIVAGPLMNHGLPRSRERLEQLLSQTGLLPEHLDRYPHEFSGGQRQRVAIARALATDPRVIIADEPVSALDVSVRAQVLNLLTDIKESRGLGLLIVSHDLAVVRTIADRVVVLYLGRIVEEGPVTDLYAEPQHPYTQALLAAVPVPDPHHRGERVRIRSEINTSERPDVGCVFAARCPRVRDRCRAETPVLNGREVLPEHRFACFYPGPAEAHAQP